MTTYRTGTHHGVTICAEDDGARCGRPGHDCARGHLAAVVVEGAGDLTAEQLAERICVLLNGEAETLDAIDRILDEYRGPKALREGIRGVVWEARARLAGGVDQVSASPATETAEIHSGVAQPAPDDLKSCEGRCALKPDPDCPVHAGRRPRGPKPPPVGPGCVCDGSGRTCPRHGAVI